MKIKNIILINVVILLFLIFSKYKYLEKTPDNILESTEVENKKEEKEYESSTEILDKIETDTTEKIEQMIIEEKQSLYKNNSKIALDLAWEYSEKSKINSGCAIYFSALHNRKNFIVGLNAGHGTKGGTEVKTLSHPDGSPKVTGGTNAKGSIESYAISDGMSFSDGVKESIVTLQMARILKEKLINEVFVA